MKYLPSYDLFLQFFHIEEETNDSKTVVSMLSFSILERRKSERDHRYVGLVEKETLKKE